MISTGITFSTAARECRDWPPPREREMQAVTLEAGTGVGWGVGAPCCLHPGRAPELWVKTRGACAGLCPSLLHLRSGGSLTVPLATCWNQQGSFASNRLLGWTPDQSEQKPGQRPGISFSNLCRGPQLAVKLEKEWTTAQGRWVPQTCWESLRAAPDVVDGVHAAADSGPGP